MDKQDISIQYKQLHVSRLILQGVFLFTVGCSGTANTAPPASSQNAKSEVQATAKARHLVSGSNQTPIIQQLTANPTNQVKKDEKITFTVQAYDPDSDALQYYWHTNKGQLSASKGLSISWQPTKSGKFVTGVANIGLVVSDGKGGEAQGTVNVVVDEKGNAQTRLIVKVECGDGVNKFVELFSTGEDKTVVKEIVPSGNATPVAVATVVPNSAGTPTPAATPAATPKPTPTPVVETVSISGKVTDSSGSPVESGEVSATGTGYSQTVQTVSGSYLLTKVPVGATITITAKSGGKSKSVTIQQVLSDPDGNGLNDRNISL